MSIVSFESAKPGPTISPSLDPRVVHRHFALDPHTRERLDDPVLSAIENVLSDSFTAAGKANAVTQAARKNELLTTSAREKQAAQAVDKLSEPILGRFDKVRQHTETVLAELRKAISTPTPPSSALAAEIRANLARMDDAKRRSVISGAIADDDRTILGALLADGVPALLSGQTTAEIKLLRQRWQTKNHPAELDRIRRLEAAKSDLERASHVFLIHSLHVVDRKLIDAANKSAKAFSEVLGETA